MNKSQILKLAMLISCLVLMMPSIAGLHYSATNSKNEQENLEYEIISIEQDNQSYYIHLTDEEIELLAKLIYLEAGTESYECKAAVGSVVLNRMTTSDKSLKEVVYEPKQFTPAYKIEETIVSNEYISIVEDLICNGPILPEYVTFFRADHYFNWGDRYCNYKQIDNVYFSYDLNLYERVTSEVL